MDLRCPRCGEPWDNDSFHDRVEELGHKCNGIANDDPCTDGCVEYTKLTRRFHAGEGCAVFGTPCEATLPKDQSALIYALSDMMGDDTDGIMSSLEDAEFMGLL